MFSEAPLRDAVRDLGLLIAAVDRPAVQYRGQDVYTPLAMKAAALMESLARNNALFDGNKRLAWLATNVFLELNGQAVQFSDNEIFTLLREVQQGYLATNELAHRIHVRLAAADRYCRRRASAPPPRTPAGASPPITGQRPRRDASADAAQP